MALFKKEMTGHVGVDIGAQGMKLVELRKNKGRPQLWTYGLLEERTDIHEGALDEQVAVTAESRSLDQLVKDDTSKKDAGTQSASSQERIALFGARLKALVRTSRVSSQEATASLPVSQVFHTAMTFPEIDVREIDHHVKAKMKKMLSRPIEEMQIVHQIIPEPASAKGASPKYTRVLATAAPRDLVSFYTSVFQAAGMRLVELETEAFALQRSLLGNDRSTAMIIDIGAKRSNFFIIDQTMPMTHRSIQIGGDSFDALLASQLGVDVSVAQKMKYDLSRLPQRSIDPTNFTDALEPIVKEIEYNIETFTKQTGNEQKRIEKIVLSGGSSIFPPIVEHLQQRFPSTNVFVGDPWARVVYQPGLKRVLDENGPRMAVSIGLALRMVV